MNRSTSFLSLLSVLSLVVCASSSDCHAQTSSKSGAMRGAAASSGTRSFELPDPALGMNAATVHVPAGWGFAGVVVHANNCVIGGDTMQVNTESPDGLTGLLMLPALVGQGSTNPRMMAQARQQGCIIVESEHAADFIKSVVLPHLRPGARVISTSEEPEYTDKVRQIKAQMARMQRNGPQGGMITLLPPTVESARVRIAYDRQGHAEEEFISALTVCNVTRYNSMRYATVQCTADDIMALHAPAGQLDALAARGKVFSLDYHPQWEQRFAQYQQQQQQQFQQGLQAQNAANAARAQAQTTTNLNDINGAAARSQAAADAINQRGVAIRQADKNRQNAIDHSAQATAQSMGDHNVYSNGSGTQYTGLSNQYSHTYDNGQGVILQTNSAYAPGGGQVWTELTPKY